MTANKPEYMNTYMFNECDTLPSEGVMIKAIAKKLRVSRSRYIYNCVVRDYNKMRNNMKIESSMGTWADYICNCIVSDYNKNGNYPPKEIKANKGEGNE